MKKAAKWLSIPLAVFLCCQSVAAAPAALTETVVTPTQLVETKNYPVAVIPHKDGSVDYFTTTEPKEDFAELHRYQSKDGGKTWTEQPCKWADPLFKEYGLYGKTNLLTENIYIDDNKTCYLTVMGTDDISHLIEAKPDGTYKELPMPVWKTEHEGIAVQDMTVAKTGDWLFSYYSMTGGAFMETVDRKTGTLKQRVTDDEQGWDTAFSGNLAVAGGYSNYLSFYDMSTGKRLRDVKLPRTSNEFSSYETAITLDETGAAYFASKHGIERLASGGSVFETIIQGDRCYLGDKKTSLRKLRKQPGADVFYMILEMDGKFKLCRYAAK